MKSPIFYGWIVVAVAALGILLGVFPIVVFSFGVFFRSYVKEFHADRAAISLAFTLHNSIAAFLSVFIGTLADRSGVRKLIVPGLAALGVILVSAEAIGRSLWQLYLFYAALGVVAGATTSVPYGLVVSRWFNRRRGLALGLMMTGLGLGSMVMPPLTQYLIANFGWRTAFAIVGCVILVIPMPMVAMFLIESPERMGLAPDGAAELQAAISTGGPSEGLAWRDIWRSGKFWLMVGAFALGAASIHACIILAPELFAERGVNSQTAALASSVAGLATLVGRIATGYLLDRYFGPYVALVLFANAAIGIALLWAGSHGVAAVAGVFLVGLAFGGEVDIIAYLMSRYFGLRSLGTAFGFCFGAFILAGGVGPLIMGWAFDRTASYRTPLPGFFVATVLAAFLIGQLGPYRFAVERKAQ